MGYLSNGGRHRNKIWHKGSLGNRNSLEITDSDIFKRKLKRFCLNMHSLHCDSFSPLVILDVSVGQFEFN